MIIQQNTKNKCLKCSGLSIMLFGRPIVNLIHLVTTKSVIVCWCLNVWIKKNSTKMLVLFSLFIWKRTNHINSSGISICTTTLDIQAGEGNIPPSRSMPAARRLRRPWLRFSGWLPIIHPDSNPPGPHKLTSRVRFSSCSNEKEAQGQCH